MKNTQKYLGSVRAQMEEFGSIHEFNSTVNSRPNNRQYPGTSVHSLRVATSSNPWEGTKTYDEAIELLGSGWVAEAKKLAKRIPSTTATQQSTKTKPIYSVVGGQASVPRYIQGIPTNMVDRKQVPMKSKIIVVNKDISFPAKVSATEIFEEGVKALQIIQGLEGKGYRVKLNMVWAVQSSHELVGLKVTVKKPEERMSLLKVAFPLAHPAMLRRVAFKWLETHPDLGKASFSGYGTPATDKLPKLLGEKEIFLPKQIPSVDKFIESLGL